MKLLLVWGNAPPAVSRNVPYGSFAAAGLCLAAEYFGPPITSSCRQMLPYHLPSTELHVHIIQALSALLYSAKSRATAIARDILAA